jgi:hypothetical protein
MFVARTVTHFGTTRNVMARGRPSKLADPAFAERVAKLYVEGMELGDIATELEAHRDTITDWVRDPRVLVHVKRLSSERVAHTTRQIDAELLHRVLDPEVIRKMDTDTLLKIRKELVGRGGGEVDANTDDLEAGIFDLFDDNPELAEAMQKAIGGPRE